MLKLRCLRWDRSLASILLMFHVAASGGAASASAAPVPRVYRDKVEPHWFDDNRQFWYRNDLPGDTREFVRVDAVSGERRPAFDHAQVAEALQRLTGSEVMADRLPVESLEYAADGQSVLLRGGSGAWRLDRETGELSEVGSVGDRPASLPADLEVRPSRRTGEATEITLVNRLDGAVQLFWVDTSGERQAYGVLQPNEERRQNTYAGHVWLVLREGQPVAVFEATEARSLAVIDGQVQERSRRSRRRPGSEAPSVVASPGGEWEAWVRDDNLWVRRVGEESEEFPLSFDGNPGHSFRRDASRDRLIGMEYDRADWPSTLPEVFWSPDGTRLVALQTRAVPERRVQLVVSAPREQLQPQLQSYPYLKPGDEIPVQTPRLFDVGARREVEVKRDLFPNPWDISGFRWASNGASFSFVYNQRGHQVLRVIAVEAATGAARVVVEERSPTFIDYSGKFYCEWLSDGELLWMSERDGWNHLYLVDVAAGAVKRQVTHGDWVVRSVVELDRDRRRVWFRAAGIRAGQDPYCFHLARTDLDHEGLVVLTEGDGTHAIEWSPDRRTFIDTWSRVDQPPVNELRRSEDGQLLCVLETADASEVLAGRGRFPERFAAKGRDGVTDIFGILHRPKDFDPDRRYPVVENIYAGPHDFHVPKSFRASYRHQEAIADLGFVVVQIDGMGTSWRSRAFHDVCWRNLKDAGFPDRIAWMRAAAAEHPELDLTRVGIYGGSAGGQNALAALLWHGDFYRVAVADCGCHDNRMDKIWWNEQWMGWPVGPHYEENSNVANAHRLAGDLLLMVGELDRNVDPSSTLQVAGALQKAGKDFDLQVIVGAGHGSAETPYGSRRRSEFLVEHLLGGEVPGERRRPAIGRALGP